MEKRFNYMCYTITLILILLSNNTSFAKRKEIVIKPSIPIREQLVYPETKYIIQDDIDLGGDCISLPYLSELEIRKGLVSNGIIEGNNSFITLNKNCLDEVLFRDGVCSTTNKVKTSYFKTNFCGLLNSICNICPEDGEVILNKTVYEIDTPIIVKRSISIKGRNAFIKLKNPGNCAIGAFEALGLSHFELYNLTIDGGWDSSRPSDIYTNQYLISTTDVDSVIVKKCIFQNALVMISNWKEKEAGMMRFYGYKYVLFDSNKITNCYVNEGVLIRNEDENNCLAIITNNRFEYVYTSSCLNAYYGKYQIRNNYFGTSRGSSINLFGHDSEVKGNIFEGSQYSCAIDLSEGGVIDYNTRNISISNNTSYYCYDGFVSGHGIENVSVAYNKYLGSNIKNPQSLDFYDKKVGVPKRERYTDKVFTFAGDLQSIDINNNFFEGACSLIFLEDEALRKNITIEKNRIETLKSSPRSVVVFKSIDGIIIRNNTFIGSGCTPGYIKSPVFISTLPVHESKLDVSNVIIERNRFYSDKKTCYIFAQSIYDRNYDINFLKLNNIEIVRNKSNSQASMIFVDDEFSFDTQAKIKVLNNSFKDGFIVSNTCVDTDMRIAKNALNTINKSLQKQDYEMNTIVEIDGLFYYVVSGGQATGQNFKKNKDYLREGEVILHRQY